MGSIVSKTDDKSSQTGFVWPLDLVRERLKNNNNNNKRVRLLLTLTREKSAGGGNKSQAGEN